MCRIIETFNTEEHIHILKIIRDTNTTNCISENNNGSFINMEDLNEITIQKIQEYIQYVLVKEESINTVESIKDKLKNDINNFYLLNHDEA